MHAARNEAKTPSTIQLERKSGCKRPKDCRCVKCPRALRRVVPFDLTCLRMKRNETGFHLFADFRRDIRYVHSRHDVDGYHPTRERERSCYRLAENRINKTYHETVT
jgi:hypothetical protein